MGSQSPTAETENNARAARIVAVHGAWFFIVCF